MGKRILVQRRGRGGSVFRSIGHHKRGPARYLPIADEERETTLSFQISNFLHEPGRGLPLAHVVYEDGSETLLPATEGTAIGDSLQQGAAAVLDVGNVLPIGQIPEGTWICNVERRPGDGGAFARSSGTHATVISHMKGQTSVQLSSKKVQVVPDTSRATVGVIAGGGRPDKPFLKAGKRRAFRRASGHRSSVVRGVAMNIVSHPHGGGSHQSAKRPTTVSRDAPPGAKVGLIAARRTGPRRGRASRQ